MSSTALGIALAIAAAIALNASYLMQHAGSSGGVAVDVRRPLATLAGLLRSPAWSAGAVVGVTGWGLHIGAMREAPLSLVQAFVAGGLALAAPMAAVGLRRRPAPGELHAVGLMVLALVLLSLGLRPGDRHAAFSAGALGAALGVLALVGRRRQAAAQAKARAG